MTNEANSEIRTKGSLCTGTGALDAATPGELSWYAEQAEAPSALLAKKFPGAVNLKDITRIGVGMQEWAVPHTFLGVDLITSGDPCQSMSAAGRQLASNDERFLWPDVARIIDYVKPREVFLENVQNIVSVALVKGGERGGVLKMRLDDLREMGYAVRWTVLGACAVGAPHHRHRWFLRAVRVDGPAPEAVRIENKCGAPRNGARVLLPSPTTADGSGGPGTSPHRQGGMNLRTAVQLLPTPRATDIGTAGRRSSEGWRPQLGQAIHSLLPTPTASSYGNNQGGAAGRVGPVRHSLESLARNSQDWGKFADAVALWEQITGIPAPEPTVEAPKGGRRLNPELSEWMMGYAPGEITAEMPRNDALKAAGNGVVKLQARAAWNMLASR